MKGSLITNILVTTVLALSSVEEQRKHHVSTSLNIKYPKELKINLQNSEEGYEHTDALFGLPFLHNRTITGSLYYMTPNFDINKLDTNGCNGYPTSLTAKELQTPTAVYLVDRGGCSFIDKASFAQAQGAEGIIIPNDECLYSDIMYFKNELKLNKDQINDLCCKQSTVRSENCVTEQDLAFQYLPFMTTSSKGQALSINIPAMLITYKDSLQFKVCLCKFQSSIKDNSFCKSKSGAMEQVFKALEKKCGDIGVVTEMKLDTPHPDGKVKLQLWMKPDTQPPILSSLEWFVKVLKDKSIFEVDYIVHQTVQCNTEDEICAKYCKIIDDTQLCYLPDNDNLALSGIDYLDEVVRQVCIFRTDKLKWWLYQQHYASYQCNSQTSSEEYKDCSERILSDLDIKSKSSYKDCVNNDGNSILKNLNEKQQNMGIFTTSVVINSRIMHFTLTSDEVGKRVCDGYASHTLPHVCSCVSKAQNEREFSLCRLCEEEKNCETVIDSDQIKRLDDITSNTHSNSSLMLVFLVLSGLIGAAFVYTRQTKKQIRAEMTSLMQEYMPLHETDSHFERMMGSSSRGRPSNNEDANLI